MAKGMSYEFSEEDGALIKRVGTRLTTEGIILILAGLAGVIYFFVNLGSKDPIVIWVYLVQSLVEIIIGSSLMLSPAYFTRVAETSGRDISELIGGLGKLGNTFMIVWIALAVNLTLDVIVIFATGG